MSKHKRNVHGAGTTSLKSKHEKMRPPSSDINDFDGNTQNTVQFYHQIETPGDSNIVSSTTNSWQGSSSYKPESNIQKTTQYNQQINTTAQKNSTNAWNSSNNLTQSSDIGGFGGDIQKAREYNLRMGTSGPGNK